MKVFTYSYFISYGSGAGVVVAESKEEAIRMIEENPFECFKEDDLELEELDTSKPTIVDMSWVE